MDTPEFWYKKSFLSKALYPLSAAYLLTRKCDEWFSRPEIPDLPSIAIGGITVGGAGKTPIALSLYKIIESTGYCPFIISRGYRGKLSGIHVKRTDNFKDVGDEPLMLTEMGCDVFVDQNKLVAARRAKQLGANALIFDDSLQSTSIKAHVNLLVIDGAQGFGNEKLLPAGPLRESMKQVLKRTDAVVILGEDEQGIRITIPPKIPVFTAKAVTTVSVTGQALAFCGLGFPEKFFDALKSLGVNLVETRAFPDHYCYKENDLEALVNRSVNLKAQLVTTRKDLVRIPSRFHECLSIADLDVAWDDQKSLTDFIKNRLKGL
ncbi:MAG: tetraacyldisaccharide 4'-kinase [Holosporales bacterium]|jgi:tetraacyldisaccharide 4'-kinase|nr:tetraacyldisaccharide 4'-kinase [Holosporales bacterium]